MNLEKKIKDKIAGLVFSMAIISGLAIVTFAAKPTDGKNENEPTYREEASASVNAVSTNTGSQLLEDKNETVYAKANARGTVREVTVEAALKQEKGSSEIQDISDLTGIKNTKGDENYRIESGNKIFWENRGEDIYYKGTSSKELPIEMKISYYLDGRQVLPEELAGKSGRVKIRFDYENHSSLTIQTEGEEVITPVPFMVMSAVILPGEVFSNIEIVNGKQLTLEGQSIAVGYAYPGVADYLDLSSYEPTEELELPGYMEISADTVDFELDFTATVVTTGSLSVLETENLDEIQEWIDSMNKLQDASTELVDGTAKLLDGVEEFQGYLKEYTVGADAIKDGAKALRDGLRSLDGRKAELETGAKALQRGLDQINEALKGMQAQIKQENADGSGEGSSPDGTSDLIQEAFMEKLERLELPEDLNQEQKAKVQESIIKFFAEEMGNGDMDASIAANLAELQKGIGQLADGSRQLSDGISAFNQGIGQLYEGSTQLYDGTKEFSNAGGKLSGGFDEAADGVRALKDGMAEFDKEGIQKFSGLAGTELETILMRLRALKEADSQYQSFSGIAEGKTGDVKFIIETDEIKK